MERLIRTIACSVIALLAGSAALADGLSQADFSQPSMQCMVATFDDVFGTAPDPRADAMRELYGHRDWRPAWIRQAHESNHLGEVIALLESARQHGLDPGDYRLDELRRCANSDNPAHRARADVLLSRALVRYSREVRTGTTDFGEFDGKWHHTAPQFDPVEFLDGLAGRADVHRELSKLPPPHAGYQQLAEALAELQAQRREGLAWPEIPAGPPLEAGDRHPQVALLRQRLQAEGREPVSQTPADPEFFDPDLAEALRAAQARFGLKVDGVLGPASRRALNHSLDDRIAQVRLNLDRWRWLPPDPGERYVLVNLAAFRLDLIEHGQSVLSQKVVVGQRYLSTPAFADEIRYLDFNPFWEIPPNLGRRSVVPKQLEDPDYFERMGIRILSGWDNPEFIDPDQADLEAHMQRNAHYRLRQDPGPENALWRVKFMFPNRHNVYLHDTPERGLFDEDVRTFSSGCIRLEKPLELAQRILAAQGMSDQAVAEAFHGQQRRVISLEQRVPVYIGYWTAWVDEHGELVFADDIYGRDEAVLSDRHRQPGQLAGL